MVTEPIKLYYFLKDEIPKEEILLKVPVGVHPWTCYRRAFKVIANEKQSLDQGHMLGVCGMSGTLKDFCFGGASIRIITGS